MTQLELLSIKMLAAEGYPYRRRYDKTRVRRLVDFLEEEGAYGVKVVTGTDINRPPGGVRKYESYKCIGAVYSPCKFIWAVIPREEIEDEYYG
jgi:hypothetical protein